MPADLSNPAGRSTALTELAVACRVPTNGWNVRNCLIAQDLIRMLARRRAVFKFSVVGR